MSLKAICRYCGAAGFTVIICFLGCDLPRLNPYDPNGSGYNPPGTDTTFQGETQASVYSEHYKNYILQDRYNLYVEAHFISFPAIQNVSVVFFDTLSFALNNLSSPGLLPFWRAVILDDYFLGISVFEVIGHPPHLTIQLPNQAQYQSEDFNLARFIEYTPVTISPPNGSIVSIRPTFVWQLADEVLYYHTFSLTVSFQFKWNVYFTVDSIPSDVYSYQPPVNLSIGQNLWWITLEDEFGDKSISTEVSFQISNEINP